MFFVARAALCIGLVAVVAAQAGTGGRTTSLDGEARAAAASLGRACLASSDCLKVGAGVLAAASGGATTLPEIHLPHARASKVPLQRASDPQHRRDLPDRATLRGTAAARG